jgi:hypothetical protein
MDPIVSCAEQTLRGSAHPALLLSELLEAVAERVDRGLDAARLRGMLEAHPERFRILEPWRGVAQAGAGGLLAREGTGDAWVVAITPPDVPPDGDTPAAISLRESVRWLARGVDTRSGMDMARWYSIAMSERAVRQALLRRAA